MKTSDKTPASPKGFKLIITRVIQAPVDMVFRAWTEPEQLRHWFSPAEVECRSLSADIKTGGSFRIHMVSKKGDHVATGEYLEIIPNQRLQFSWTWEN
jgi:uncharacterized protein YndB with AHSA1/START domain